ncbi:MAG: hypothetical protein HF308_14395 [Ignavibacteria bacterium]|jgi:hypothetical protein|nr:hypothetical protein [Ignavibacteria bacterium]
MNLDRLREWLIQRGIPAEELDQFVESPIVRDIGEGLALSLMNDDSIGEMVVELLIRVDMLEQRVAELEGGK